MAHLKWDFTGRNKEVDLTCVLSFRKFPLSGRLKFLVGLAEEV